MFYALDHRGVRVSAAEARGRYFTCPNPKCRASVTLRSGWVYQPYFAHLPNQGTADCDLYYGGAEAAITSVSIPSPKVIRQSDEDSVWGKASLVLSQTRGAFFLSIVLPHIPRDDVWSGSIEYHNVRGMQEKGCREFKGRSHFDVHPQCDDYTFKKRGDVDEDLWQFLSSGVPGLGDINIFRNSEIGGRRLDRGEALEYGQTYLLLMPPTSAIEDEVATILSSIGKLGSWAVFKINMPNYEAAKKWSESKREIIEHWFEHKFRMPTEDVWITDPLPLGAEADIWAFPPTDRMCISVRGGDGEKAPFVISAKGGIRTASARVDDGAWSIDGLGPGYHTLRLGNRVALNFKVTQSEPSLASPSPLTLSIGGKAYGLLSDLDGIEIAECLNRGDGRILPAEHPMLGVITVAGEKYDGGIIAGTPDSVRAWSIEAGSYGYVAREIAESKVVIRDGPPQRALQLFRWLMTLPEPSNDEPSVRLPYLGRRIPIEFERAGSRRWKVSVRGHVASLWNELRKMGGEK